VVFSSIVFLFYFLPAFLILYAVVPGTTLRNLSLLLASLLFYAWGEPWFVLILCGQILFNYSAALVIHASEGARREHAIAIGVIATCCCSGCSNMRISPSPA
jgi:D-alanyl-lipoteichoic acid acyltransferase DltB (MBOAT superfamily)